MSDLDAGAIERLLAASGALLGLPLSLLRTTRSTNDDARQAARRGVSSGAAFVADEQTLGRGRLGRTWHSPPGQSLYASFVLRPNVGPSVAPCIALAAGLAVADVLAPLVPGGRVALKWPNDVLCDGRKIAGILSEAEVADEKLRFVIVGIGLNVAAERFPDEIAESAISLALAGVRDVSREELFVRLCSALGSRVRLLETGSVAEIVEGFSALDALAGRTIEVDGFAARALGIAPDGRLRIARADGRELVLAAGEVTIGTKPA
jgi:BirA family transcriptional regulator, biotin operon repressor / biotin---[acetyl-CoA-carboxylase] ligase